MNRVEDVASQKPRAESGLRKVVRNFTPNWFTVTMGTGVLALALEQFPLPLPGLHSAGLALWLFTIALFLLFTLLYATRWICFSREARGIFRHPVASMFFGAIPMGLATLLNGFLVFGLPLWGETALSIAHGLWWLDVALALACGILIPFVMFTRQDHSMEKMTAVWLLPIVAAGVAAASGGLLAPHLPTEQAFATLIAGYVLWAFSVPLAMSILVILLLRLALHKLPQRDMAASGWLSLGPIGTGALGLLLLGREAPRIFAEAGLPGLGEIAQGFGVIGALLLWGYGSWWLLLALLKTAHYLKAGIPFNMGWWGFTFPLGVYALATLALGRVTNLTFFTVAGGLLVLCLAGFWSVVATRTAQGAWRRTLFVAPYLPPAPVPRCLEAEAVQRDAA